MLQVLRRSINKVYSSSTSAISDISSGSSLIIGGFGLCGIPENLIRALHQTSTQDLTLYTTLSGTPDLGPGMLITKKMIKILNTSYIGAHPEAERQYFNGEIELNLMPMGSLVEQFRAGSCGLLGFYTKTGVDTIVEHGGFPSKFSLGGKTIEKTSTPKESKLENGQKYVFEKAITADFALIKAWKADSLGNLIFRKTARNSNADIPGSARVTIAEVEEIVPVGSLDPDQIHVPGILVDRVVQGERFERVIERLTLRKQGGIQMPGTPEQIRVRELIARRAGKEIKDGMYLNLGIGIPTLVANYITPGIDIVVQGENGVLGIGPYPEQGLQDADLTNAGKESITLATGAAIFSSSTSFGIIRGGHLDLTFLGGLQVSERGDLASWIVPGKLVRGIGGSMDLVSSKKTKCIVCMEHTAKGSMKVLNECSLPLTGKNIVDLLITDFGVFEFREGEMNIIEIAEGVTVEQIIKNSTAKIRAASDLKQMQQ